jgi:signal transduction histidine kinase
MMQEKQFGDNIDNYTTMIERSLARLKGMRNLIMDLLDLTRIESGKKERRLRETDLSSIARQAMDTMEPYAIQKNVKMSLSSKGNTCLLADADELEIIFNNLISNAVKYNKNDGKVNVHIEDADKEIIISVSDTGIGMNKEDLDKIFEDFVRIKNQKTKEITGSGLGLSIVKRMLEQYNGTIHVESKPDEGSVFTVRIPRQ